MDEGPRLAGGVGATTSTLPARLAERDQGRFFGREAELAYLDRCGGG